MSQHNHTQHTPYYDVWDNFNFQMKQLRQHSEAANWNYISLPRKPKKASKAANDEQLELF